MANVNDCLIQLQQLTQKNLDILQAINDSFLTNKNHLSVEIGGKPYAIPSFISLENKVNNIQENFENLINAPKTGEAYFNMNGNSRSIEVRGYTHTPHSVKLNNVDNFEVEKNNLFTDFLTPSPYVKFDLAVIPNDITSVNIKKIIPKTDKCINYIKGLIGSKTSIQYPYAELYKNLYTYVNGEDYIEYDNIKKLPVRKNIGSGSYVIESIDKDYIDENLDEYLTLKIRNNINNEYDISFSNDLTYKLFDETISRYLEIGDQLVTYDDSAKMEIVDIQRNNNIITIKILNGEYLNLIGSDINETDPTKINDLSKLKFFSPVNFDDDKYIKVPLEEDEYVFIAIAPVNDRMNIQSPWGTGVLLNSYKLTNAGVKFDKYYHDNVLNIGDILNEITQLTSDSLTKLSGDNFNKLTSIVPELDANLLKVTQINKHLNDSVTVKNIRTLYSQKLKYNNELTELQSKIDDINSKLANISYDDTSNIRVVYVNQLSDYNKTKNELVSSITKVINEISLSVNSSDIPIENAKYHIRGFFDVENFEKNNKLAEGHVKGIKVQYRYKNLDNINGSAITIGEKFLFSDWNDMPNFLNTKTVTYDDGFYKFTPKSDTSNQNIPSYNQIDIPISQGETVDIRLMIIYDYGYPYAEISSQWSDILNIEFPKEYIKDVQITDIIAENNSDIETNRFQNILKEEGVPSHINDKIIDQDIIYYHKPENIASGFYTNERRIIPLKDKLEELTQEILTLKSLLTDTSSNDLSVSLLINNNMVQILPNQSNKLMVESYYNVKANLDPGSTGIPGYSMDDNGIVSAVVNLILSNKSNNVIKMHPLFPGNKDIVLSQHTPNKYDIYDYTVNKGDIFMSYKSGSSGESSTCQTLNQFMVFRSNNPYTDIPYYSVATGEINNMTNDVLYYEKNYYNQIIDEDGNPYYGAWLYPYLNTKDGLCVSANNSQNYEELHPGQSIIISLLFKYKLDKDNYIRKTMSFDVRTSLYKEPINYTFSIEAKYQLTDLDRSLSTSSIIQNDIRYSTIVAK